MAKAGRGISRRNFLKSSATIGLGALTAPLFARHGLAASKKRVTIYPTSVIDNLNPYAHSSSPMYGNWQHIIEPLVDYDFEKAEYRGVLAESWEFQGKQWVFKLRKGIEFHNGAPLTSKDVAYSYMRMKKDKQSLQRRNFKDIVEIKTPDDQTVILVTKKPSAILLGRLNNRHILSKVAVDKYGEQSEKHLVGTGPYKFTSFQRGGNLVMTRNDNYWQGKPDIEEVIFRKVTEDSARLAAIESGQADIINNVPIHEIQRLSRQSRLRVEKVPGLRLYFLAINPAFKPFDNVLVRRAVNHAVNAESIVKNIFDDAGFVVDGPVGPQVIGANPDLKRYPFDPDKSKALLKKAGFSGNVDIQLHYSGGRYPKDREVCQVIGAQLAKAGFNVELISSEWAIFWGRERGVNGGKLPFYYIGRGTLLDADTVYDQYFRTGTTKRIGYSNPAFDKLIVEEQQTGDHQKRVEILQQAGKILMDEVPFVPLYQLADLYGAPKNVIWKARPDEKILAGEMKIRG